MDGFVFANVGVQGNATSGPDCVLARLQGDCVRLINEWRTGVRTFSDGSVDPTVPLPKLVQAGGQRDVCSNEQVMGDLVLNVQGGGGCAGIHQEAQ